MLTLGQASKATGISKTAIARAASKGRLSASRNELGEYQIDPAELFRVYPPKGSEDSSGDRTAKQDETPKDSSGLQAQLESLREERERERQQLTATIDDLRDERGRLLKVIEEQAGAVKQLTYQPDSPPVKPEPPPPAPVPQIEARPPVIHPAYWLAFGAITLAAALTAPYWLPWWTGKN